MRLFIAKKPFVAKAIAGELGTTGKTKPPSRFTEGALQRAMENIHKYVTDAQNRISARRGGAA